jgi:Xaa-Pro aminopeptidase
MLYFGGLFVPDPFIAFSDGGKRVAVMSPLEIARARKESQFDEVLALDALKGEILKEQKHRSISPAQIIAYLAKARRIASFKVPAEFPYQLASQLMELGVVLEIAEGPLFAEREKKTDAEAAFIRAGNAASSAGFRIVEKYLRESEVRKGYIWHGGRRLTSEALQEAIAIECLRKGATAANTIVAGGDQACDPHCRGTGPLRANSLIIVDIFPRVHKTGYHGDMTRTYLKGEPSDAQRKLYNAVYEAQQWAVGEHRAGKSGAAIDRGVKQMFCAAGFETKVLDDGTPVGFFHGLGHGLGLDVHEPPRVNASGERLKSGQVITVEPGLYYPGLGGVRIEDVVRVRPGVPELLSRHSYRWCIR